MSALLALSDSVVALAGPGTDFVIAAGSDGLVKAIRNFVGPIFLLAIGLVAMSFLVQRQMTQFLQFIALAVGIAVLFYYPNVVENIASFFKNAF